MTINQNLYYLICQIYILLLSYLYPTFLPTQRYMGNSYTTIFLQNYNLRIEEVGLWCNHRIYQYHTVPIFTSNKKSISDNIDF